MKEANRKRSIYFRYSPVADVKKGIKTVTRIPLKVQPRCFIPNESGIYLPSHVARGGNMYLISTATDGAHAYIRAPYKPGDVLYVRETWRVGAEGEYQYYADYSGPNDIVEYGEPNLTCKAAKWRSAAIMPKEAARVNIRVKSVRPERLNDIYDDQPGPNNQIVREGFKYGCDFVAAWENSLSKKERPSLTIDMNPWVWVIEFVTIAE